MYRAIYNPFEMQNNSGESLAETPCPTFRPHQRIHTSLCERRSKTWPWACIHKRPRQQIEALPVPFVSTPFQWLGKANVYA